MPIIQTKQFSVCLPKKSYEKLKAIGQERDLRVAAAVRVACDEFIRTEENRRLRKQAIENNLATIPELVSN